MVVFIPSSVLSKFDKPFIRGFIHWLTHMMAALAEGRFRQHLLVVFCVAGTMFAFLLYGTIPDLKSPKQALNDRTTEGYDFNRIYKIVSNSSSSSKNNNSSSSEYSHNSTKGVIQAEINQTTASPIDNVTLDQNVLLSGFRFLTDITGCIHSGLPYKYTPPEESRIDYSGSKFDVDPFRIERLRLPPESYFNLTKTTVKDFQFVTAADHTHYWESIDCVASIQELFPGYVINYYDIGLKEEQAKNVSSWCNVKLRRFQLHEYPSHVKRLYNKCFKYLVIQQALTSHGAVFWVDASFRAVHNVTKWNDLFEAVRQNGGIIFAQSCRRYRNLDWTSPGMFDFLVSNITEQRSLYQYQSGAVLIYNTKWAFTRVLWWMYLCALDGRCCQGQNTAKHAKVVDIDGNLITPVHRSDQSALNILLSNAHGFISSKYRAPVNHLVFERQVTHRFTLQICE